MINIIEQNGKPNYNVINYLIDSIEDIQKLPKNIAAGSTALLPSATSSDIYILTNEKQWVLLLSNSTSEGGKPGPSAYDIAKKYGYQGTE